MVRVAAGRHPVIMRPLIAVAWSCLLLVPPQSLAQQRPETAPATPLSDFFSGPLIARPVLSPSGRYVAFSVRVKSGRVQLAVTDLEKMGTPKAVGGLSDADVASYQWVNDQRLVFDITGNPSGSDRAMAPGLWAVDRDGGNFRSLIDPAVYPFNGRGSLGRVPLPWTWRLHSVLVDGSNDVLVQGLILSNTWEFVDSRLARLNTLTGASEGLFLGAPDFVTRWVVDRRGTPQFLTTWHRGRFGAYAKTTDGGWEKWQDADGFGDDHSIPYWIDFDGQLLSLGRRPDGTWALYKADPRTRQPETEPMIVLEGYDFNGTMVFDHDAQRLLGVHYETDATGSLWFDPKMQATQAAVNAILPATVNRIDCRRCLGVPKVLVTAASDRQPPLYYVYDRDTKELTLVGASRHWIKAQEMGRRDMYRFAARDGLSIPVLVTHPPGKASAPRPAVVLVHGGPWVRGTHWQWQPEAQFLASRGYVVIEPEFRGSLGYGNRLFRAGWKQWGLAMQDDIADATNWAVAKGWVDPARVCIAGASYGGYATLMGLVRHHDIYRCGISWVGVTDVELLYSLTWSDLSEEMRGYSMPLLIGDRVGDAQQLKDASPVELAARVRRPVLLAYGGADRRVPIEHGRKFKDAVSATNRDVEWVVYPDEGHGWRRLETRVDFWGRVEKFLDRHIGAGMK